MSETSIYFCCVASRIEDGNKGFRIRVQYPSKKRQLADVVDRILSQISHSDHLRVLSEQNYHFFYSVKGQECVMCVASHTCKKRTAFKLIECVQDLPRPSESQIKDLVRKYNDPKSDKIAQAQASVDEVKVQVIDNIDKVLKRGDNLDTLVVSTDEMATDADYFRRGTKKMKQKMAWRLILLIILFIAILLVVFVVIIVVLILFILFMCGTIPFLKGCGIFKKD